MKIFKRVLVGFVIFFILGCVGISLWTYLPNPNYYKATTFTQKVLRLPVGSSKAHVAALLKNEGLSYSYVGDKEGIDFTSAVMNQGYTSANLSGYMVAIIRDTSRGVLITGDVQYFFFFDKKGKLLKATADEVFTGP